MTVALPELFSYLFFTMLKEELHRNLLEGKQTNHILLNFSKVFDNVLVGTLNFVCYMGWAPASSVYPKKYTVYQPYQKTSADISIPNNFPLAFLL